MKAFHNDQEIKNKYLRRVRMHIAADNLIRGNGWDGTKGCAVGCTLEDYDHKKYETELGIPEWLARVEDRLFEGMSLEKSKTWPEVFLEAIPLGVDLDQIKKPFLVVVLKSCLESMDKVKFDATKFSEVEKAIKQSKDAVTEMIRCHENNLDTSAAWSAAWSAAASAAESARSAWSAAASAAWSAARSAAASAARSAAWSAAWSAAESAAASAAASAAESARSAWSAAYDYFADELLNL